MRLSASIRDLDIAASEIEKMKSTTDFNEFREAWENYLFRLERAWEVSERLLRRVKGIERWNKPYIDLRKKDSLLVYLKQARNSEMHSVSVTVTKPLKLVVKDNTGFGLSINSISQRVEKGKLTIDINTDDLLPSFDVDVIPTTPELVRVKNRGKWYNPPWAHLKVRINDRHPVAIAIAGVNFYRAYVAEAETWIDSKI